MRHLSDVDLIEIAEGTREPSSVAHLTACGRCRRRIADLRLVLADVRAVEMPEPSPLFWDHLSARVRTAVAAEGGPPPARWVDAWAWRSPAWLVSTGALAAIVCAAVLSVQTHLPPEPARLASVEAPSSIDAGGDDAALGLVADLAADLEWDQVADDPLALRSGAVDGAVAGLTDRERRELQRLLKGALARPGA